MSLCLVILLAGQVHHCLDYCTTVMVNHLLSLLFLLPPSCCTQLLAVFTQFLSTTCGFCISSSLRVHISAYPIVQQQNEVENVNGISTFVFPFPISHQKKLNEIRICTQRHLPTLTPTLSRLAVTTAFSIGFWQACQWWSLDQWLLWFRLLWLE